MIEISMQKFSVTVLTNGSLLKNHSDFLEKLQNKRRICFSVSLDGSTPEKNAKTRGVNTFQRTLEGIKFLASLGYRVNVLCTLTSFFDSDELYKLIRVMHEADVRQLQLTPLQPVGRGREVFENLRPTNQSLEELLQIIPEISKNNSINIGIGFGKCYDEQFVQEKDYHLLPCKAGITQISVTANGDIYPCNALNIYMGNILEEPIDYIMNESEGAKKIRYISSQTIKGHPICNKCEYDKTCTGGCRGIGYGYSGDVLAPDIYCDRIHLS